MLVMITIAVATAAFLAVRWLLSQEESVAWRSSFMDEFGPGTRRLGMLEESMVDMEEYGVIRLSNIIFLRSKVALTTQHIHQALRLLAHRHPLLRSRILTANNEEKTRYFKVLDDIEINLTVSKGEDWMQVLEDQLLMPYEVNKKPLWRVVFLPSTNYNDGEEDQEYSYQSACVFGFHHAIVDGTSYARLFGEFLDRLHDVASGVEVTVEPYQLLAPIDAYIIPLMCRRWQARLGRNIMKVLVQYVPFVLKLVQRKFMQQSAYVKKFGLEITRDPSTPKTTCIIPVEFSVDDTSRLLAMCKKHKSTVHGAIQTAACTAFVSILQEGSLKYDTTVAAGTTCNMRPYLKTQVPADYVGPYFLFAPSNQIIGPSSSFWNEAANTSKVLHKFLDEKRTVDMFNIMATILKVQNIMKPDPAKDHVTGNRRSGLVFTNLGNLKFLNRDPSKLVCMVARYGCSAEHDAGQIFANNLATFNGKLFWTFVYYKNIVSKQAAQKYADLTRDVLLTAMKE